MDLNSIFANFGSDPWANLSSVISGGANLYGGIKGAQTANNVNQGVQQGLGQNTTALQQQIDALTQQTATNRQQAQDMYQRSLGDVTSQNTGLQGNIDTLTGNLNALSDPNSPYMQQARQAIERKDAAAGRRSQWGDRETQLAAALAENVSKYAPGIQQSITGARNQISQNNQGLASLYSQANNPADRNTLAQIAALQAQLANVKEQNTTGRGASNAATNSITGYGGAIQGGLGAIKGLMGLFGGGGSSDNSGSGAGGYGFGSYGGLGQGFTGGQLDNDYFGLAGNSSLDQGMAPYANPYNFTSTIGTGYDPGNAYQAPLDFNDPDSGWWD